MNLSETMLEKNITQEPAIEVLKKLGYVYLSPEECNRQRFGLYNVVLKDILKERLKYINNFEYNGKTYDFSNYNIEKAISDIDEPLTDGLVKTSEKIFNALMLGKSYVEDIDGKKQSFDISYIDWKNPKNNVYHVTKEFVVERQDGQNTIRIDLVLFVNGIPLTVIECKAPTMRLQEATEQSVRNQGFNYIPQLFKYVSLVISTNKNSVEYGTTGTAKKFFSVWNYERDEKEYIENKVQSLNLGRTPTYQDYIFATMLAPERLLELTQYFVLFDANVKKVARYQQYYGVKNAIKTITSKDENGIRQSGVIWHTQGSGKSLTMAMLAKYILTEIAPKDGRVIIVTDRKELDKQIAKTFSHTKLRPSRATSGKHLIELIESNNADVITTIINKFTAAQNKDVNLENGNIFVLVDESHRSNYGLLATKMRIVFPNACYVGFTGTPLMRGEKNTVSKFGGNLIHTYTIKDGVDDKAIVPLIYEGRFVEQKVDQENIDLWFKKVSERLSDSKKDELSRKWSSLKKLNSTDRRIERIALDIDEHFGSNFKNTGFKAMLATNFKLDAVRYYNAFKKFSNLEVAVSISAPDMREGYEEVDESDVPEVTKFWQDMMKQYGDADSYEDSIKNKFIDGDIDILIVCSKLLTGFDAPICQVMYLDKELKEHTLLQAIARTNRIMEGKDYGLIVDYRGLISRLDDAMGLYSGAGLEGFDAKDLKGVMTDVLTAVAELRQAYGYLENVFSGLDHKNDVEAVEVYLEDEAKRQEFYNTLLEFGKKLALVLCSEVAYNSVHEHNKKEMPLYKDKFAYYSKIRVSIKKRYCEGIDNKEYEAQMRNLLNTHLSVVGLKHITAPVSIMDKGEFEKQIDDLISNRAKADAIRYSMSRNISIKYDENPAYYESFSKRIQEILELYKNSVVNDVEYLERMQKVLNDFRDNVTTIKYPEVIKQNVHAQAFYGVILPIILDGNVIDNQIIAEIALKISDIIAQHSKVDWSSNLEIHNKIAQDIDDLFFEYETKFNLKIAYDSIDKIIENVKTVAIRRY